MKKRLLSMLLSFCIIIGTFTIAPIVASAASGTCGDNLTWEINNGTLIISGTGDMYDYGEIWSWDDTPTSTSPFQNQRFSKIIINEGVTSIGKYAFYRKSFNSIELPNTLKRINYKAFAHYQSMGGCPQFVIPDSVECVESYAFFYYTGETFKIGSGITTMGSYAFQEMSINTLIVPSNMDLQSGPFMLSTFYNINYYTNPTQGGTYSSSISPVHSTNQKSILDDLKIDTTSILQNISCGNHSIKGPSITFQNKTFYLFEFDGKLNLDLAGLPVSATVDTKQKTVKLLIGFKDYNGSADISSSGNDSVYWSQSYQQVKSMYQDITGKKVNTTKLWNEYSAIRGKLKKMNAGLVVDAGCTVTGFMELSYETGDIKFSEGGLVLTAEIGGEFSAKIAAFPAAYVVMGLNASIGGKFTVNYEEYISLLSKINAELSANVGVGLGDKSIVKTYIEGGLVGTLGADMYIGTGMFSEYVSNISPLMVYVEGDVYLKGAFLGFFNEEKRWPIGDRVQLYPRNNVSLFSMNLHENKSIDEIVASSKPLPRDYLYDLSLMSIDDSDKIYSDKNVYSYNSPILTYLSDGNMMLLWVDDLGTKNDINKTSLMYSLFDGKNWSESKEIYESGTYNGTPVIYNDGEKIHILWSRAKTIFDEASGLSDLMKDVELVYSCFANGSFSEPVLITENSLFELNYDIVAESGNIAIAWTENSENDPYMTSGNNKLYVRECINGIWQKSQILKQDLQAIDEIEVYYSDKTINCAYTMIDNENNTNIYNNSELISEGSYLDYENNILYYLNDDKIKMYDTSTKTISESGIENVSNFKICNGNAYTLVNNGFKTELYESINTNGTYENWKQITEFERYIRDYSVTTDLNNEPVYALNLVEVQEKSENIYGASELVVCKAKNIDALKVSAVYYDEENIVPSGTLPLSIDITNEGTTDIFDLDVKITDNEGNILSNGSVNAEIFSGTSDTIVYNYILPPELELYNITITVTSSDKERNLDNNSVNTSIGYTDILVSDVRIDKTESGAKATGRIYNSGHSNAENVVLSVYNSSYPDEVLTTIECLDIASGESYNFTYDIPEKYLTLEDKMTMYGLTFKANSDSEESNYANNTEKAVFGELTDYTISVVDNGVLLDIITIDELKDYKISKNGYTFEGWYTDSLLTTNSRLDTIPETISENMMVYANWIPININKANYENNSINVNISLQEEVIKNNANIIITIFNKNSLSAIYCCDSQNTIEHTFENISQGEYIIKVFCWKNDAFVPLYKSISQNVN